MDAHRSTKHPSLSELRAKAQPIEVRSRKNAEHWTAQLYLRHISIYFTMVLVRTKITANGVTGLMILAGWCIAGSLLIPGMWGAILAVFFSQVQMYIDCCDGEVARWRGTSGAKGVFLDKVGHYTTESLVAVALGVRAVGEWQNVSDDPAGTYPYLLAGTVLAGLVLLNKALNEMVHVSRAFNGLDKLPDSKEATALTPGLVARLKRVARFVPFHRIYHSVEMSLMAVLATLVTMIATPLGAEPLFGERWLVLIMAPLCFLSVIGHFLAIMSSKRLS